MVFGNICRGIRLVCICFSLASCSAPNKIATVPDPKHTSQNSLDWEGSYIGILPCADCEGIQTFVELSADGSYRLTQRYLGKLDSGYYQQGKFVWDKMGKIIRSIDTNWLDTTAFEVGENTLTLLNKEGKHVTGVLAERYTLSKTAPQLYERYWKANRLFGKPIIIDDGFEHEPYLIFKANNQSIIGNASCNAISGGFLVFGQNRIEIQRLASSLKACPASATEKRFNIALEQAFFYIIQRDSLKLLDSKNKEILSFEAVLLR